MTSSLLQSLLVVGLLAGDVGSTIAGRENAASGWLPLARRSLADTSHSSSPNVRSAGWSRRGGDVGLRWRAGWQSVAASSVPAGPASFNASEAQASGSPTPTSNLWGADGNV